MRVLGIDPGVAGAACIAALDCDPVKFEFLDLPTVGEGPSKIINAGELQRWIRFHSPTEAALENVWSMPKEGVSSAFRFGRAVGALQATLGCAEIPYVLIAPAVWKRFYNLIGKNKEASRLLAIQRYPVAASHLQRKKDHQRSEALLLAMYHSRVLKGMQ